MVLPPCMFLQRFHLGQGSGWGGWGEDQEVRHFELPKESYSHALKC